MKNRFSSGNKSLLVAISVSFVAFWTIGYLTLDPDFGWHLKMGQIILQSGIPKTDPFSYTMPSFPLVDHEWLTDIMIFKLYPLIGRFGLAAIAATLALFALLIQLPRRDHLSQTAPFLLAATVLLPFVGIRPQVLSWFLFSVLLKIIFDKKLWVRVRFLIPALFLIWANLHGGFAVGLAALLLFIAYQSWNSHQIDPDNLVVLIISVLITLVNPYSLRLWREVARSFGDPAIRWSISEWTPFFMRLDLAFLLLTVLSAVLLWKYKNRVSLLQAALYTALLLAGLSSQRNIPFCIVPALPLLILLFSHFHQEMEKDKIAHQRFHQMYKSFTFLVIAVFFFQGFTAFVEAVSSGPNSYPQQAVAYLQQNPPDGHLFTTYGWGGYLIWQLPGQKVFVDGLMPSWRWTPPDASESGHAFDDYLQIAKLGQPFDNQFQKFNVTEVLWEAPVNPDRVSIWGKPSELFWRYLNNLYNQESPPQLPERLEATGWWKVYQDKVAVIYQKP